MSDAATRLWRLLDLVAKEDHHLAGVSGRLFADVKGDVAAAWLASVLGTPEGIDRLESFVGKFSRMHDTMMDKLLPTFLVAVGERTGTVLDNLNLAQKLGFVADPNAWLAMRLRRNRLVHEYVDDLVDLAAALQKARDLTGQLSETHGAIRRYADEHLHAAPKSPHFASAAPSTPSRVGRAEGRSPTLRPRSALACRASCATPTDIEPIEPPPPPAA